LIINSAYLLLNREAKGCNGAF